MVWEPGHSVSVCLCLSVEGSLQPLGAHMSWCQKLGRLGLRGRYWADSDYALSLEGPTLHRGMSVHTSVCVPLLGWNPHKQKPSKTTQDIVSP